MKTKIIRSFDLTQRKTEKKNNREREGGGENIHTCKETNQRKKETEKNKQTRKVEEEKRGDVLLYDGVVKSGRVLRETAYTL